MPIKLQVLSRQLIRLSVRLMMGMKAKFFPAMTGALRYTLSSQAYLQGSYSKNKSPHYFMME
jgi:hypothetical protein